MGSRPLAQLASARRILRLTRCQGRLICPRVGGNSDEGPQRQPRNRDPARAVEGICQPIPFAGLWKGLVASIEYTGERLREASACVRPFEEVQRIRHVGDVNRQSEIETAWNEWGRAGFISHATTYQFIDGFADTFAAWRVVAQRPWLCPRRIPPWCACRNGGTSVYIKAHGYATPVERNPGLVERAPSPTVHALSPGPFIARRRTTGGPSRRSPQAAANTFHLAPPTPYFVTTEGRDRTARRSEGQNR